MLIFLIFLVPFVVAAVAKVVFDKKFNYQESFVCFIVSAVVSYGVIEMSKYGKTQDTELLNGMVTSKKGVTKDCPRPDWDGWTDESSSFCSAYDTEERKVGESCSTDSKGNTSCTPIYETYYRYYFKFEKRWYVYTNLKTFEISRVGGRYKQGLEEPKRWTVVKLKDPVSITNTYTNYVKAVPESMFNAGGHSSAYDKFIPAYPKVSDYYNVRRVISIGYKGTMDVKLLNYELGKALGRLNPRKQVNVNLILNKFESDDYSYAVENKWVGGKKNDVNLFIGMSPSDEVLWVRAVTFGKNDYNGIFSTKIEGRVSDAMTFGKGDELALVALIEQTVNAHFDRPSMEKYEYLESQIEPTEAAVMWAIILNIIISVGLAVLFVKYDFDPLGSIRSEYNSRKRRRSFGRRFR